jgi:ADP-heptose:LPS heptosyltransferase
MAGVAILKPDHLGDLVLSVPAIRAIRARHTEVTLFVAPGSLRLARFLFPDISNIHPAPLTHLMRGAGEALAPELLASILDRFEFVFLLRYDPVMQAIAERLHVRHVVATGDYLTHETNVQRHAVAPVIGEYSRTKWFGTAAITWPLCLGNVGLCIAAGFPTNRWPNIYWLELARRLAALGLMVTLVGGPAERRDLIALSRMLARVPHQVIEGGADVGAFLDTLARVDLVVASDGGTAHLCSLRKPIVSLFGSSPWRRYAPFGAHNVLLTRDEPCSPCVQFSATEINGCVSRECTALLQPRQVERVVLSNGIDFSGISGVRIERGVSHRSVS